MAWRKSLLAAKADAAPSFTLWRFGSGARPRAARSSPSTFRVIGRSRNRITGGLLSRLGGPLVPGVRTVGTRFLGGVDVRGRMRSRHWEAKNEFRPGAFLALHADRPFVRAHDSERHRQAETRPLARSLGREERLEDAGLDRPRDAGSVVLDGELD